MPETASQHNKEHLLVLSNGILSEIKTFSYYDKLLKMCPELAIESSLRGAKPRWLPKFFSCPNDHS